VFSTLQKLVIEQLMKSPAFDSLGLVVARARVVLCLAVVISIYVDRTTGGFLGIGRCTLITLIFQLFYGLTAYLVARQGRATLRVLYVTGLLDLFFASVLALFTEGPTSPALAMFLFAITATGYWGDLRSILVVTVLSVISYLLVIVYLGLTLTNPYLMRAAYLGIAGYLIDFFGQQREKFERRVHELEAEAERQTIARSLHDSYIQALAGISLRLESCRDMLISGQPSEALTEVGEIQAEVSREYDGVRQYVRTLAGADWRPSEVFPGFNTQFRVQAAFVASGLIAQHLIQIVLESIRNTQRHAQARSATINVHDTAGEIRITIDDDGIGFGESISPPWTIASRVAEFGGKLAIRSNGPGARLEIAIPTG
jgi:signal transduction histidine kinase